MNVVLRSLICSAYVLSLGLTAVLPDPAEAETTIPLTPDDDAIRLLQSSDQGLVVSYVFSRIDWVDMQTERGVMTHISIPGLSHSTRLGDPKLPVSRRIISVPLGAEVTVEDLRYEMREIPLRDHGTEFPLMPAQPSVPKNLSPSDIPFEFNPAAYAVEGYGDRPVATVEELGILRGLRLFLLVVEPVKYDPATQKLAVYNNIEVEVTFDGGALVETERLRSRTWSPYFESLYRHAVLNYGPPDGKEDLTRYPVKYVVISDPMFESQLQPFIEWKTMKGFDVIVGYVGDPAVGSTTNSIKDYIQGLYDAATPDDPAPSFVLFVGDVAQIPAWNGTTGGHVTDLHYVTLEGSDYMPEIYHGRFSANTPAELQPQIDKTLEYERYEMPDPGFLGEAVMIAGVDYNFAEVWANGQINYGTTYYFNEAHGIVSHTYLYPESGGHAGDIINDVSNGVGYANYTAHGYEYGWGNPGFGISDIQGLDNSSQYPTVVGNCCLTNAFNVQNCFGEAWLRADGKGGIGYIGATNSSYWNEDYWWGVGAGGITQYPTYEETGPGTYDGMFHDHGEPFPDWYTTQFAFNMAGCLAVIEGGSNAVNYYWEIYTLMGDPSLSTYFSVPTTNVVSYPGEIKIGDTSMDITAEPWSYVGLSRDGELCAASLVDETGHATLEFQTFTSTGEADLVITRQNREPIMATVTVAPAEGPVVILTSAEFDDTSGGNGNGCAEFGEQLLFDLTVQNAGSETAYGVDVRLSTTDQYTTVTDSVEQYGDIAAGEQAMVPNGFEAAIDPNIPNNHVVTMQVTIIDNAAHEWNNEFTFTAYAPLIDISSIAVNDSSGNGDGALDPDESATLELELLNDGGASLENVSAVLSSTDPYITIDDDTETVGSIGSGQTTPVFYDVTVDAATPAGHFVSFSLAVAGDNYALTDSFSLPVGLFCEDFESGDFSSFPWVMGGNAPWTITQNDVYEGSFCAKSGDIGDQQTSDISVSLDVIGDGAISFFYKVSSEANFDYLRFYIDGVLQDQWSGNVDWTEATYSVASGSHTFLWRYRKDQSVSEGSDCAWLDNILFPPIGEGGFPEIDVAPVSFEVTLPAGQEQTEQLTIANSGEADLTYTISVTTRSNTPASDPPAKLAKGEFDPRKGAEVLKGSGGPDGYGYTWIDSDEEGGPLYEWIDISSMGTSPGSDDDANYGPIDLGFPFSFYGTEYATVQICTNGWMSFSSSAAAYTNQQIPGQDDPNNLIAPFWDDLDPTSGGTIYYHSDPTNERFIVEWDQVRHYDDPPDTGTYTFQAVLFSDGRILYQYDQLVGSLTSCTIGIENQEGTDGLEVVFNQAYLHDSLAVLFEASEQWLTVTPESGTVGPNTADVVAVTFNSGNLADGTYQATITITSNDADEPSVAVPVTMHVEPAGINDGPAVPTRFELNATPNPFSTTCRFGTGSPGIRLDDVKIYDVAGNLIWRGERVQPGTVESMVWRPAPAVGNGLYIVRATVGKKTDVKKIIYLR